jgi:Kef-type K+ transport system membrane component KefB
MGTTTLSSLVVILGAVALAPLLADALSRWILLPGVVLEILAGITIGPATGLAHTDDIIRFLSQLGLCTLMFLGGLEVDLVRVRGTPLRRSATGWLVSLGLGVGIGFALQGLDGPRSGLIVGLCATTTAFGILLPMLRDRGELPTPFGTAVLAGASIGEIGPVVAVTLLLGTDRPLHTGVVLVVFAVAVVVAARIAARERNARMARLIEGTLDTSGQLGVRLVVLALVAMVWLAAELGLDVLMGAFAAGMVVRLFANQSSGREVRVVESKLHGLGFGFLVPVFFVVSGMQFDLDAVVDDPRALLAVPAILLAFVVVRGLPTALAHRDLAVLDRAALACYLATALPLIVVITTIGVETGRLDTSTAAALVTAGMASVVLFPLVAGSLRAAQHPNPARQAPDLLPSSPPGGPS